MKKLRLDLESLAVETFSTALGAAAREGTVEGREARSYDACAGSGGCYYTMSDYSAFDGCTLQDGCTNFMGCTGITYCYWTP